MAKKSSSGTKRSPTFYEAKSYNSNANVSDVLSDGRRYYDELTMFMDDAFEFFCADTQFVPGAAKAREAIRYAYQLLVRASTMLFAAASLMLVLGLFFPPIMPVIMTAVLGSLLLFAAAVAVMLVPIFVLNTYIATHELRHLRDFMLLEKAEDVKNRLDTIKERLDLMLFDELNEDLSHADVLNALKFSDDSQLVKLAYMYEAISLSITQWKPASEKVNSADYFKHCVSKSQAWLVDFEENLLVGMARASSQVEMDEVKNAEDKNFDNVQVTKRIMPVLSTGVYIHEALNRLPLINLLYRLSIKLLNMTGLVSSIAKPYLLSQPEGVRDFLALQSMRKVFTEQHERLYPFAVYDNWVERITIKLNEINADQLTAVHALQSATAEQVKLCKMFAALRSKGHGSLRKEIDQIERVVKTYVTLDKSRLRAVGECLEKYNATLSSEKNDNNLRQDLLRSACGLLEHDCSQLGDINSSYDSEALEKSYDALVDRKNEIIAERNKTIDMQYGKISSMVQVLKPKPRVDEG